jgi:hypothetical protein
MYYNTNKEAGSTLKNSRLNTNSQEKEILKIFVDNKKLSASEAWNIYDKKENTPITSIRRAITNLCNDCKLIKTEDTTDGLYGKKEHIYQLYQVSDDITENDNQLSIF